MYLAHVSGFTQLFSCHWKCTLSKVMCSHLNQRRPPSAHNCVDVSQFSAEWNHLKVPTSCVITPLALCGCLISSHLFLNQLSMGGEEIIILPGGPNASVLVLHIGSPSFWLHTHTHPSLLQPFKTLLGLCNCLYLRAITLNWWGLFIPSQTLLPT